MGNKIQKNKFRHELKYEMELGLASQFFDDIQPYCELDKHATATKSYEIASIYYDTADLRFYRDREESVGYRRKIRLRAYNTEGKSTALFIEIKEKNNNSVFKRRAPLAMKHVEGLMNGEWLDNQNPVYDE